MQGSGENSFALKPVPLKGGLDLTTPRMLVEPGKLVDCLNYECVDTDGYKKIDGFERYDGGPSPSVAAGYYLWFADNWIDEADFLNSTQITIGGRSRLEFQSLPEPYVSCWISVTDYEQVTIDSVVHWRVEFVAEDPTSMDAAIAALADGDDLILFDEAYTTFASVEKDGTTNIPIIAAEALLDASTAKSDARRLQVQALPQTQMPYGLQLYKDRMHVVANCRYLYLAYDTATSPAAGAREMFPGNTFRVGGAGNYEGVILDYRWLRKETFADLGSTAANRAWLKVLVYPTVPNGTLTTNTTFNIDRVNSPYTNTTGGVTCWKYYSAIDNDGPTDDEDVWGGVLYKGIEEGEARDTAADSYTQIDMGYEVFFENGDSDVEPRELTLSTTQAQLDETLETSEVAPQNAAESFQNITLGFVNSGSLWAEPPPDPAWSTGTTADQVAFTSGSYSLLTDEGNPNQTGVYATRITDIWGDGTGIQFKNFGLEIPAGAVIRGIKIEASCWQRSATGGINNNYFTDVRLTKAGSTNKGGITPSCLLDSIDPASPDTFTFGGEADTWGVTLTRDEVNDATFGVIMTPNIGTSSGAAVQYLFWARLKMTVYYFVPVGKAYFYNATDADHVETKLVRIGLDSGSWADGTAKGVAHVYDPVATATRNYIKVGDALRLTNGGTSIATVTAVKASFLPSHTDLVESTRMFEIIRANYFLNPDWETIYGVHGLGRAWSYDNRYFRKIYTEYDSTLDKPSHICSYKNYLVLGFASGNVLLSAISGDRGPLPEEFRSTKGAREFSFVDDVHGLQELADTSLGVFCRGSVHRLVLNPNAASADGLFYQAAISPNSGSIEYTVDSFGDSTLYCDQYGIRTVEQTDVYGDLVAKPLSYFVSPWLRPRLSTKKYWLDSKKAQRPVLAHTVKAKNQYRVWFDDGYVLCMNLNSKEEAPQFTFLQYGLGYESKFVPLVPIAISHSTDNSTAERIHIAHWNRSLGIADAAGNSVDTFKYVFELEKGWSFDGEAFPTRMTVNLTLLESPYNYDSIRKAELHGLDYQNTTLFCGWGTRYSEELSYDGLAMGDTFTPAGRNEADVVTTDYVPFSKMIQVATRGRPLMMKLKNTETATGGLADSALEPPHILQAVLLQYIPLRNEG